MANKPKLNVHEDAMATTASAELIRKAMDEHVVTDARGRRITLRKPSVLAQYDIVDIVGSERAKNQVWMGMMLPVTFVVKIDSDDVFPPNSYAELRALIQRLDDDGINAINAGMTEHFGVQDAEADKTAVKK